MNDKELIDLTKNFFSEYNTDGGEEQSSTPTPVVDIYQRNQDRIYDVSRKKYPRGASAIVGMALESVVDGAGAEGLARAYNRAKEDVQVLKAQGERGRAEIRRQQYMQENFLPALELVINSASPDELLNSKEALEELDKYVLLEGSGSGYTANYVRQAYGNVLGQKESRSDALVRSKVAKLNALLDAGETRLALGIANDLKEAIDSGKAEADEADYELVGRICAYYN